MANFRCFYCLQPVDGSVCYDFKYSLWPATEDFSPPFSPCLLYYLDNTYGESYRYSASSSGLDALAAIEEQARERYGKI
jgi:hypothetical protein